LRQRRGGGREARRREDRSGIQDVRNPGKEKRQKQGKEKKAEN
jgi:hypothetical protein